MLLPTVLVVAVCLLWFALFARLMLRDRYFLGILSLFVFAVVLTALFHRLLGVLCSTGDRF